MESNTHFPDCDMLRHEDVPYFMMMSLQDMVDEVLEKDADIPLVTVFVKEERYGLPSIDAAMLAGLDTRVPELVQYAHTVWPEVTDSKSFTRFAGITHDEVLMKLFRRFISYYLHVAEGGISALVDEGIRKVNPPVYRAFVEALKVILNTAIPPYCALEIDLENFAVMAAKGDQAGVQAYRFIAPDAGPL